MYNFISIFVTFASILLILFVYNLFHLVTGILYIVYKFFKLSLLSIIFENIFIRRSAESYLEKYINYPTHISNK